MTAITIAAPKPMMSARSTARARMAPLALPSSAGGGAGAGIAAGSGGRSFMRVILVARIDAPAGPRDVDVDLSCNVRSKGGHPVLGKRRERLGRRVIVRFLLAHRDHGRSWVRPVQQRVEPG